MLRITSTLSHCASVLLYHGMDVTAWYIPQCTRLLACYLLSIPSFYTIEQMVKHGTSHSVTDSMYAIPLSTSSSCTTCAWPSPPKDFLPKQLIGYCIMHNWVSDVTKCDLTAPKFQKFLLGGHPLITLYIDNVSSQCTSVQIYYIT